MWDSLVLISALTQKNSRSQLASALKDSRLTGKALSGVLLYGELTAMASQSMLVQLESLLKHYSEISTLVCVIETSTNVGDRISLEEDESLPF